ncbi:MAG: LysR family transcriptional regulator substrate-binding protein [Rhodospirillaceae bacterium]|nr:LysR family transcriptional regulator substrate-binding protein [Rhodospirillaceae bacterium]
MPRPVISPLTKQLNAELGNRVRVRREELEDEFGGQLFRRERNLTHCTDLGRLMRPHLTAVFEASEAAANQAKDFSVLEKATLNLGVMCTIGPARLIGFIERLSKEIPNLELKLRDAPGCTLVDEMMAGDLDIAIIGVPNIPERFDTRTLYSERYVVAFSQGHRFEQMNAVPLGELDQEDYLARINCEYTEHFNERGVPKAHKVNVRYQSERESWVQALILAGMGCAIMPEFLPMLQGIATRVLIEPEIERDIQLVTVGGRRYSPPVQSFIRLAHRYDWSSSL